jgi:hypothetical protein
MRLRVVVKDKLIDVQCGEGTQSLKWYVDLICIKTASFSLRVANVALSRYDANMGVELGTAHHAEIIIIIIIIILLLSLLLL